MPFRNLYLLFIGFIVLCGLTHLLDGLMFWWPAYRLSALMRFFTALISVVTVYYLAKALPQIFNLRTVHDLEVEMDKRMAVEEKLKESEQLCAEAVRMSQIGAWELDLISGERKCSKIMYDILALPYDTPMNDVNILEFVPEPYKTQRDKAIELAIAQDTPWDLELEIVTKENKKIWVRSKGEPVYDKSGKVVKLKGTFMNINKYKTTELALALLSDVNEKKEQLKNFTHILSHNIRSHSTNLTTLTSLFELDKLDENNTKLVGLLHKVSNNLSQTLDDLSNAIRIKEIAIPADQICFTEMTKKVLDVLQPEINKCNALVELDFTVKSVLFPKVYFESILLNLVSNAIKYRSPKRNLLLQLSTYKNENGTTILECRDNGLGINLEKHGSKLFGLYKTFHGNEDAHGVGLFMAKTQIESNGGRIMVDSTLDNGTAFKIFFNEKV